MAGDGIVTGSGEGLERNRAATRITGRNDVADDEPGETGSLCYVTNPWYPVRYRGCCIEMQSGASGKIFDGKKKYRFLLSPNTGGRLFFLGGMVLLFFSGVRVRADGNL